MNKGKYLKCINHYEFDDIEEAKQFADELINDGYYLFYVECGFEDDLFVSIVQYELNEDK